MTTERIAAILMYTAILGAFTEAGINMNSQDALGTDARPTKPFTKLNQPSPVSRQDRSSPFHLGNGGRLQVEFTRNKGIAPESVDQVANGLHVATSTCQHVSCQHYSCHGSSYDGGMSDMHERLKQARISAGFKSAAEAAAALGVRLSTYRGHENGQNQFKPPQAAHYGKRFGVSSAWLLTGAGAMRDGASPARDALARTSPASADLPPLPPPNASPPVPVEWGNHRIAMRGQAAGGSAQDGRFVLNGQKVMDALCPPQLVGVPDAYGVFVHGDSMEPRYFSGEAVFVNPHQPVRQGDFVVVQIAGDFDGDDISGYVKRFRSQNSDDLVLEQYKRRESLDQGASEADHFTLRFPRDKVVAVHKIVATAIV